MAQSRTRRLVLPHLEPLAAGDGRDGPPAAHGQTLPDPDAGPGPGPGAEAPHHHGGAAGAWGPGLERGLPAVSPRASIWRSGGGRCWPGSCATCRALTRWWSWMPRSCRGPVAGWWAPAGSKRRASQTGDPASIPPSAGKASVRCCPARGGGEPHRELKAWHPNAALANIQWAVWTYGALQAGCRASGWTHDPPRAACQQHRCWTARDVADAVRAES